MKNIFALTACLCLVMVNTFAQKAIVNTHKENINEDKVEGYKSTIEGSADDIISQWTKNLRSMGKYRERGTYAVVTDFAIGNQLFEDSTLYATVQSDESTATVWLGSTIAESEDYDVNDFLKSTVYDFTISYHRSVVQKQIDEAERAVLITTRRHQRLTKDSVELANKLVSTKNEIIRLQQLVERNQLQTKVLDEKLILNSNARDSVFLEIGKMKVIVEGHKKRKNAIE
jgi:hypothetical protein